MATTRDSSERRLQYRCDYGYDYERRTTANGFSYTLNGVTNAANYTFDVTEGVLKVTKGEHPVRSDATDYSDKYDGDAHGVTASANVLGGTTIYYRTELQRQSRGLHADEQPDGNAC